ncbi:hypothetical protein PHYPSEUDO_008039 [Phytophthora pseudosyringae]|uniref:Uncharacterized protein n=1 Tax=Phytophthora pseudosyringae TaxID=221518 RepID=A0A8T1VFM9_9STRA|nr:hypothetical protein PHYPSEUDO_008039 [Phytophthora pseudosyringae]
MSLVSDAEPTDEQFLAEVLSLLDVEQGSWPYAQTPPRPKPKLSRLHPRAGSSDTTAKPKRIRKDATPRVRNKAKIELLRHEIKGLEAVLASLQNPGRGAAILERRRVSSLWKIIARKQSHERQLAEQRNMGLKRMLVQQYALTRSLTRTLDEWTELPATERAFQLSLAQI